MEKKNKESKAMKILIIRTFPNKLNLNSYNVQEIGLAKALTVKGHCCDVILYGGREKDRKEIYSFQRDEKEYSFSIFWLKGYNLLKNGFMPSVKKMISQYDIIQVHEYDQIMSWLLYSRPSKPTVIYHGPYFHPFNKGYNFKCKVFDLLFLNRRSHQHVVAITKSELAAGFMREKGFEHVIPVGVGVDVDNFHMEVQQENRGFLCQKKEDKFRILYVGKIEERRNVYFLIEVFRKLNLEYSNLQLMLVGDGEKKYVDSFLNSINEEIEKEKIIYIKKATQEELSEIYQASDLFLFTSNYDIFGMVLLEAMYFGLPVISTLNGGASTLIDDGKNGYIIDEFDAEKWSEKIAELIDDRERLQRMGKCAGETIRSGYTWDKLAEKFEIAYKEAINLFPI